MLSKSSSKNLNCLPIIFRCNTDALSKCILSTEIHQETVSLETHWWNMLNYSTFLRLFLRHIKQVLAFYLNNKSHPLVI